MRRLLFPWPMYALAWLGLAPVLLVMLLLLPLMGLACECLRLLQGRQPMLPWLKVAALTCGCLWLLSACGTAPLQGATCPPVPAALLTPPQPPVLLLPGPGSKTPGATTRPTPPVAPKTGHGTAA
jgi:hypothetical protein